MRRLGLISLCFVAGIMGGVIGGGLVMRASVGNKSEYGVRRLSLSEGDYGGVALTQPKPSVIASISPNNANNPVIGAVKRVGPAVVNIDTTVMRRQSTFGFDFFGDEPFTQVVPSKGQGSGLIVDGEKGYVLTNEHVVHDVIAAGKGEIKVSLPNRDSYDATIVGADPQYDVAILKIEGKNLPSAKLASSKNLVIGEWAVAVGNPFGYRNTVTLGVVSAVDRALDAGNGKLEGLIQTDAAINPGNSGGPLCDIQGNVIGMNTAIINGAEGLGFAIGASTIKPVMDEIIKYGRVKHGWIGMNFWDINQRIANRLGLKTTDGALVSEVYTKSPADLAGVKPGDVVLEANGKKIMGVGDMQDVLRESRVGDKLLLTLLRGAKKVKIDIQLVDVPAGVL